MPFFLILDDDGDYDIIIIAETLMIGVFIDMGKDPWRTKQVLFWAWAGWFVGEVE